MSRKSFVSGAIILMAAGLVVRIFGFVFRIYLSNLIGAEGMGLFQLIWPVYSLIVLTLTAGVSIAVSKMVAEELARKHPVNLRRITNCALGFILFTGAAISLIMYLNIDFIVNSILKDSRTYISILLLIPCIPVIAASSALKGYFYGTQSVVPTALSQIAEQLVKIGLVMLIASSFVNAGLEYACALAVIGTAFGEIANLAVLVFVYRFKRRHCLDDNGKNGLMRKVLILKRLAICSIPISSNRFLVSIMSLIEYILIPGMLVAGGLDYQSSLATYGKLMGMAMPLIFFPSLVTSSLATTLVPAISEAVSLKNFRSVNYRISKSIQATFILGVVFTAIFLTFPGEIGNMIYRREQIGNLLFLLSFSCAFVYLQQTLTGVMNGLGKQAVLLRNTVIGSAIRIASVCFLIPEYGIESYIVGLTVSILITDCLNLLAVNKITGMPLDLRNWLIKPVAVGIVMVLTGRYIFSFIDIFFDNGSLKILIALAGDIFTGLFLMAVIGVLSKDEIYRIVGFKKP